MEGVATENNIGKVWGKGKTFEKDFIWKNPVAVLID
jgi:hypothetical protein